MPSKTELQRLSAVRQTTANVFQLAKSNLLDHFTLDLEKLPTVTEFVVQLIRRDYKSPKDVPAHSRWRHFDVGGVQRVRSLLKQWSATGVDSLEQCRRLLDLFVVSVLLDAGAGDVWCYKEASTGNTYGRSEGLAVASLDIFLSGGFSSDSKCHRVDSDGLANLSIEYALQAFQSTEGNELVGLEGRINLLKRLGDVLTKKSAYFGNTDSSLSRPGHILDFLLRHPTTIAANNDFFVQIKTLWDEVIIDGFNDVWPASRTKVDGSCIGDVWPCDALKKHPFSAESNQDLVAFHKLSQWLTYSLMEPMTELAGIRFQGLSDMTGLAEYRSGGLFVDFGVIKLKAASEQRGLSTAVSRTPNNPEPVPLFEVSDPVIVEWRALTIQLLDLVGQQVRSVFGFSEEEMPLVKVLEGGTWKAGREISTQKRPKTKGPPIQIISDGTVF